MWGRSERRQRRMQTSRACWGDKSGTVWSNKWDESASNEEKLERIITQKWLALFPLSTEGWAEQRRTGCQLHQPKPLAGIPRLFYTWEFPCFVGNKDPSGNAVLTHPLCASTESFNPGLFSQCHLESSPRRFQYHTFSKRKMI